MNSVSDTCHLQKIKKQEEEDYSRSKEIQEKDQLHINVYFIWVLTQPNQL